MLLLLQLDNSFYKRVGLEELVWLDLVGVVSCGSSIFIKSKSKQYLMDFFIFFILWPLN